MESNYAETRAIGFGLICAFFALGPFILPVFILYSAGHWLKRLKNHPDPARRELADMMGGFLNSQDPEHY